MTLISKDYEEAYDELKRAKLHKLVCAQQVTQATEAYSVASKAYSIARERVRQLELEEGDSVRSSIISPIIK